MRVLGISGSLRRDSYNTKLLRAAGELLEDAGAEFVEYDALKQVPPYDEDDDVDGAWPPGAQRLRDAVKEADAVLFSTPEYNSSVPGQLKNAVDWLSRPKATSVLLNKPVAVIGASTGMFGAVWAQAELKKVLAAAGARVTHDTEVPIGHAQTRFDEDGRLVDDEVAEEVGDVVGALVRELEPARA